MIPALSTLIMGALVIAAVISVGRVLRSGHLADRVIGFDVLLLVIVGLVVVDAAARQQGEQLELPLVIGLLGFLGTVTAAVYIRGLDR